MHVLPKLPLVTMLPKRAMVFAAGLGTRMQPITEKMPKPLVEVGGKAMIDHMLDRFAEAGVGLCVVNVHHHADQLEAHLAHRKTPKIIISDERAKLLDQGGGIRKALPHFGNEPFFLCNTDSLWLEGPQSNVARMAQRWDPERMDILLLVAATAISVGIDWPGDFTMDSVGRLVKREERQVAPFAYAGVGIIKPELFANRKEEVFRLAPIFFDAAARGRLYGHRLDGLWCHVGTPEAIADTERFIRRSVL
jgi:N-acetyl-alpha-D-muramate 1-phosphate uridylyltransferase